VKSGSSITASGTRVTLSQARLLIIFFGVLLGATLSGLDGAIVATAAPTIISELGDVSLLPWLTTSYLLAQVTTMAVYGKVGDILGRKRVFTFAVVTFMVGSVLCGSAQSMPMFIATRALQGIGAGGITALAMALIADVMPADRLGRYLGYTGVVYAVTSVLGPWAGGFFTDQLSWRWAFYVNIPSGILCLLTIMMVPTSTNRVKHRVDFLGAALVAGAVASLLLGISGLGGRMHWIGFRTLGLVGLSAVFVLAFIAHERRTLEPILSLRVLTGRVKALAISANLIAGMAFGSVVVYTPLFIQAVRGISATRAGLLLAPFAVCAGFFTVVAGQITDRRGGYVIIPGLGLVSIFSGVFLLSTMAASSTVLFVVSSAMLCGLGVGFSMQTLLYVFQRFNRPSDMGVATSTVMLARLLGNALGVALVGSIFTDSLFSQVSKRLPDFSLSSIQGSPEVIAQYSDEVRVQLQTSFANALGNGFRTLLPFVALGVLAVFAIPAKLVRERLSQPPVEVPLMDQVPGHL